jgi:hypothetical protein
LEAPCALAVHDWPSTFTQNPKPVASDGQLQNFRVLTAWELIADPEQPRCYFICEGDQGELPTLRTYLNKTGKIDEKQEKEILRDLLQTLLYLHGQKFTLLQ